MSFNPAIYMFVVSSIQNIALFVSCSVCFFFVTLCAGIRILIRFGYTKMRDNQCLICWHRTDFSISRWCFDCFISQHHLSIDVYTWTNIVVNRYHSYSCCCCCFGIIFFIFDHYQKTTVQEFYFLCNHQMLMMTLRFDRNTESSSTLCCYMFWPIPA